MCCSEMTYGEKFYKLEDLKKELSEISEEVKDAPSEYHRAYFYKIYEIAVIASDIADGQYNLTLGRIERGLKMLSNKVLEGCVEYAEWFIKKADKYLTLKMADEYTGINEHGFVIYKE